MHDYDVALKLLLRSADQTFLEIAGVKISRWLDVVVLYVGNPPLRMAGSLRGEVLSFRYSLMDAKDLDGQSSSKAPRSAIM